MDSIGLLHFRQLTCPIVRIMKNKQIIYHVKYQTRKVGSKRKNKIRENNTIKNSKFPNTHPYERFPPQKHNLEYTESRVLTLEEAHNTYQTRTSRDSISETTQNSFLNPANNTTTNTDLPTPDSNSRSQTTAKYKKSQKSRFFCNFNVQRLVAVVLILMATENVHASTTASPDYKVVEKQLLKVLGIKRHGAKKEDSRVDYLHRIYTGKHSLADDLLKSVNTARQFGKYAMIDKKTSECHGT